MRSAIVLQLYTTVKHWESGPDIRLFYIIDVHLGVGRERQYVALPYWIRSHIIINNIIIVIIIISITTIIIIIIVIIISK